jgi:hypothetical protein
MGQPTPPPSTPQPVVTGGAIVAGGSLALTTSATLAAQAALAASFYQSQAFLAAMATRDILTVWRQLNLRDVRSSWPALRTALAALIRDRYSQASALGQAYYGQARQAAGVPGEPPRVHVPPPPEPQITATLDSTGPWNLLGKIKQGQQLATANENTAVQLAGSAQRLITNGARQAVMRSVAADDKAVAWARVTSANPCAFCALLAGRGAVYRSEKSASFDAHNHDQCVAMPLFSHEEAQATKDNPLYDQWKRVTKGHGGAEALKVWRRHWDAQQNRDGVKVLPAA